ncbi:SurA N-terminal domain-containing protein [Lentisphaera profundi]|uniref:SurA N-terminal domain-containing protein n=1 Tax=Lentisphaera profundi TaxID=1658616 RepID=A0ABY7VYE1_9BACT|nr:SurA N-terminal domain-containing protein [Lentisphaera profundi]WDE98294.1 SurA N-terminal domain-containing protein [Lentisphaera profundi]
MKYFTLLTLLCLSTFGGRIYKDSIMAKVNGHIITSYDIQELSYREEARIRQIFTGPELPSRIIALRKKALGILIEEQLILDHFNGNEAFQVPSSLLEERIEKSIARRFGTDRDKFYDMLHQKNMTVDEYRKEIERGIILELMRMEFIRKKIVVTPSDIALYYAKHKSDFATPSKMHIKLIIISKDKDQDGKRVAALNKALNDGENFDGLMSQSDSQFSGDLGFLKISDIRPDFIEALQDKKSGDFITIEETSQTLFVQLSEIRNSEVPKLETINAQIKRTLQSNQEKHYRTAFINDLKKSAKIEKYVK